MLNVCLEQNITQYKPSFKSKNDYSQIYKEMEKITLRRDEKIIPKIEIIPALNITARKPLVNNPKSLIPPN